MSLLSDLQTLLGAANVLTGPDLAKYTNDWSGHYHPNPLAVARPDCAFTLLDANAKKTRFVTQAAGELGLKNVDVVQERVENYRPEQKFDTLVARAFSSIADMLNHARHLCAPGGRFLAMKGVYPEAELAAIPADYAISEVVALTVPDLEAARHLVIITPRS